MSLPLITLPHIITSSLALSLVSDLLPRLSHSNPNIRKKTIATLYRLALVYPDTLRAAWPKIKDVLMDEEEDSSVTAAVINVVCELGWRRPRDFLALAPRLFDLLVDSGNNWMAIKIIKLFATLTPLEPRLIKKLLPPLTNLIRTTPAMSLLYECINGVIQGGILEGTEGAREGDEIASLCVGKLRGMIVVEGDPNLKYVALLAFNRIVSSHPHLVSMHQDVIMGCIDDLDISIRLQALDLGAGMVTTDNLVIVVERLMKQLRNAPLTTRTANDGRSKVPGIEPVADSDSEDTEETLRPRAEYENPNPALPAEYRLIIIRQILDMCGKDTYANIVDFEWYIDTLVQLVRLVPATSPLSSESHGSGARNLSQEADIGSAIGWELRNVAVRVATARSEAVRAANSLLAMVRIEDSLSSNGGQGVLTFAAWVVGEYSASTVLSYAAMESLVHPKAHSLPALVICAYLQAVPKVLVSAVSDELLRWDSERKTMVTLLVARIIHFLEPLTTHPNLEVQERSVEFLELMRVTSQAVMSHGVENTEGPLLLTKAIPQLFSGFELKPVAPAAQRKVPLPDDLDLDSPINAHLGGLLQRADQDFSLNTEIAEFDSFYNQRPAPKAINGPAFDKLPISEPELETSSYQQTEARLSDADVLLRKRTERRERNKDDPFYIGNDDLSSGTSTPFHDILRSTNGEDVDVDAIPIMNLDLGNHSLLTDTSGIDTRKQKRKRPKKVHIAKDENIDIESPVNDRSLLTATASQQRAQEKAKRSLLQVDSSGLSGFSLNSNENAIEQLDTEDQEAQDNEMDKAIAEVERLRLEMQRASERIQAADGTPAEGIMVKKKKKKKKKLESSVGGLMNQDEDTSRVGSKQDQEDLAIVAVARNKVKKTRPAASNSQDQKALQAV